MNGPLLSKGGQVYYGELDKKKNLFCCHRVKGVFKMFQNGQKFL